MIVWPIVNLDGKWMPDDVILRGFWREMVGAGTDKRVFYQGRVKNEDQWVEWLHNPDNMACMVIDIGKTRVIGVAWLNHMVDRCAYAHFVTAGRYHRGAGEAVVRYWSAFKADDGKPLFRTILAVTPETYRSVHKGMRQWGFRLLGVIPNLCHLGYEGRRVGGMVGYYCPQEVANG